MAQDGLFFKPFGRPHPKFETPHLAIIMTAFLGIAFVMMRTFEQLADAFVTALVPFYALGVAAIFTLRKRADYNPSYRVPGYPVVPLIFILGTTYLIINAIIDPGSRWPTLGTLGVIALGLPVYYMTVGKTNR